MATRRNPILYAVLATAGLLLPAAPRACGQNIVYWQPPSGTGDWFTGLHWRYSNGTSYFSPPASSDTAILVGGYSATVASPGATASSTYIDGTLNVTGGGSLTNSYGVIGLSNGSSGVVTVGGGAGTSTWSNSTQLVVGNFGTGTLNINSGGYVITPDLAGGNAASRVNFNGGTLRITGTDSASNTMNLLAGGGTIDVPDAGHTFTPTGAIGGTGGLTKTGYGTLTLAGNNTYAGDTNINGGTLSLGSPNAIGSAGLIYFNGGALQFTATNTTDYSGRCYQDGTQAFRIDTNGQSVTFASELDGVSLTKIGAGTLTTTNNCFLTGAATVTGGTLHITGGGYYNSATGQIGGNGNGGTVRVGDGTFASGWINSGNLYVGHNGTGTLNITGGGTVSNLDGYIGNDAGPGTVNVGGGTGTAKWTNSSRIWVGNGFTAPARSMLPAAVA